MPFRSSRIPGIGHGRHAMAFSNEIEPVSRQETASKRRAGALGLDSIKVGKALSGPNATEEARNLGFEIARLRRQPLGPAADLFDGRGGVACRLFD